MRIPVLLAGTALQLAATALQIHQGGVHLRSAAEQEWSEFPVKWQGASAKWEFASGSNAAEWALSLRQRDVKLNRWIVRVNGANLGVLQADERDMRTVLPVPASLIREGSNVLEISIEPGRPSDDIEVSDLRLFRRPVRELLSQATVSVQTEADGKRNALPVRITVVDAAGALVPFAAQGKTEREAVRTGVVYAADGNTRIGLPYGEYEIFASRGWEYSAPSQRFSVTAKNSRRDVRLRLKHEVRLPGYVSCDTHVHTLELSGHGDASLRERMITAAGEGLDIIVATEHNQVADYSRTLRELGLERTLSAVRGNEVTTRMGHFNVFPLAEDTVSQLAKGEDWKALQTGLTGASNRIIVQNHPRDVHSAYRPFDPVHHISPAGENLMGRPFFANALEVINSGAMYSDMLQPVLDWLGLLNRGYPVAAVGASDTHTVDFVPIGQARTCIRAAGNWRSNIEDVFTELRNGNNFVSYGLGALLKPVSIDATGKIQIEVEVHGPSWSTADTLTVYANGWPVMQRSLNRNTGPGVKFRQRVALTVAPHDVVLAAVATGPGVRRPFWEVRKPYQPVSKDWRPMVMGVSNALRLDIDGGGFASPRVYAQALVQKHAPAAGLASALARHDSAVAVQALTIIAASGRPLEEFRAAFQNGGPTLRKAWESFATAWSGSRAGSSLNPAGRTQ